MFTRCPACHTLFRIQPRQLKAARGQVRCGSCQAVFDGLESLVNREELSKEELTVISKAGGTDNRQWQLPFDDLPAPDQISASHSTSDEEDTSPSETVVKEPIGESDSGLAEPPQVVELDLSDSVPANEEMGEPHETTTTPVEPPVGDEPPIADKPAPKLKWSPRYSLSGHEPETVQPRLAHRLGWSIGSLLLIALLGGQLAWFNRNSLALDPRWRPWLQMACDQAGCVLPPQRDPGAIEMVDRNVQSHPQYLNALLITATLVNQAPFAQPYPQVELAMTDLDQKKVASRRFMPSEYLEGADGQGLIPPGGSVRLKLEIADPGQDAVGFEFEFY